VKYHLSKLLLVSACALPFSLMAQNNQIEEVVVTSTKQEKSIQDVPAMITALTAADIEQSSIENMYDVAANLPTLRVDTNISPMATSIRIRGIGSAGNDPAMEPSVAIFVDGVYLPKSGLGLSDIQNIERIEVLQGPQGTLYGKNATAGVINVITQAPNLEESSGYFEIEETDFNGQRLQGAANMPLGDNSAIRASFATYESDGFMKNTRLGNTAQGADDTNLTLRYLWQASDNLKADFKFSSLERNTSTAVDSRQNNPVINTGYMLFGITPLPDNDRDGVFHADYDPIFELKQDLLSMKLEYELDNGIFTSITSLNDYDTSGGIDLDYTGIDLLRAYQVWTGEDFSQEFRFNSDLIDGRESMLGFFYQDNDFHYDSPGLVSVGSQFSPLFGALAQGAAATVAELGAALQAAMAAGQPLPVIGQLKQGLDAAAAQAQSLGGLNATIKTGDSIDADHQLSTQSWAFFGQRTWHLSDSLRTTLGLRYGTEEKTANLNAVHKPQSPLVKAGLAPWALAGFHGAIDADYDREDTAFTWSASIQKDISDQVSVYASAGTAFKSGGFNTSGGINKAEREFKEEEAFSYEMGTRMSFAENRLIVNMSYFNSELVNRQFTRQLENGVGTIVGNALEDAERTGFEINVRARPHETITINLGLMRLDDGGSQIEGAGLRRTSDEGENASIIHALPIGNGRYYSRLDYAYEGLHENTTGRNAELPVTRKNINARIGWRTDDWDFAYFVKNLTDENTPFLIQTPSSLFGGTQGIHPAFPKTAGISVRYNF
jgi:iron complex outermembrane receptor protein